LDAVGRPVDGKGPLDDDVELRSSYDVKMPNIASLAPPSQRKLLETGVKVLPHALVDADSTAWAFLHIHNPFLPLLFILLPLACVDVGYVQSAGSRG
jgi:hypothetical protein